MATNLFHDAGLHGAQLPQEYYSTPTDQQIEDSFGGLPRYARFFQDPVKERLTGSDTVQAVAESVAARVNAELDRVGGKGRRLDHTDVDHRTLWHKINERLLQERASEYVMFPTLHDCSNGAESEEFTARVLQPVADETYQEILAAYVGRSGFVRTHFYNPVPIPHPQFVSKPPDDARNEVASARLAVPGLGI